MVEEEGRGQKLTSPFKRDPAQLVALTREYTA